MSTHTKSNFQGPAIGDGIILDRKIIIIPNRVVIFTVISGTNGITQSKIVSESGIWSVEIIMSSTKTITSSVKIRTNYVRIIMNRAKVIMSSAKGTSITLPIHAIPPHVTLHRTIELDSNPPVRMTGAI